MRLVNLTPHEVVVLVGEDAIAVPATRPDARCEVAREALEPLQVWHLGRAVAIPLGRARYGAVTGLPGPQPDLVYIVSRAVAEARPDRNDLVFPDEVERDAAGIVIGCRALGRPG